MAGTFTESDSSPRLLPVRQRIGRRGRDLERFINLWRLGLGACMTALLVVARLARGSLNPEEAWGLAAIAVLLVAALGFQLYLAWYPWNEAHGIWVVAVDVLFITTSLLIFVIGDRAIVATNSPVAFLGYSLIVALAGLRSAPRVARMIAWAVPGGYALVIFLAVAWRAVHYAPPDPDYGSFRWVIQIAGLLLLAAVTWIIHLDVALGASDRIEARHDPLTGLYNRRYLEELLARELAWALEHRRHLSVLLLDLDGFKAYNDAHGHLAGDRVLEQVAASLAAAMRPGDSLVRFGGDEFVVVLPNTAGETARRVARDLIRVVPPEVGLSAGVACVGEGIFGVEQLLRAADAALMRAKQAGGGAVAAG